MAELKRKNVKKKSAGAFIKDSFMTGISYMIPVIVGGGVLRTIAKVLGGYNIGAKMANIDTFARVVYPIGSNLQRFMVPAAATFMAYAMTGGLGIVPGPAMGALANSISTGFISGLIGGILVGYVVLAFKKINVPKSLQGIMSILVIPVFTTLIYSLVMYYILERPISWGMTTLQNWLMGLNNGSKFMLGAVIGAMICFDMDGPIGRAAVMFINGLNADGFFTPTSVKICSGMTAPMGVALMAFLSGKKKFDAINRENAKSAFLSSFCHTEETVIPFLVSDPVRVIASCVVGGAVTGGLCMVTALESPAVRGSTSVIAMTSGPLLFVGLWMLESCITGVLYALLKKPPAIQEENG